MIVYFLFLLSGISGLIFEVVWLRMLVRILGSTVYATSAVLSAFMAGLAIGSYVLGRSAHRLERPLRCYGFLELGIGLAALGLPLLFDVMVPVFQRLYHPGQNDLIFLLIRTGAVFLCLLIPTSLMGGTLPILGRMVAGESSQFASRIGFLYGANTLGAVLGSLGSGFVLIGTWGEWNTILAGVALNGVVAAMAFFLDRKKRSTVAATNQKSAGDSGAGETEISPYSDRLRRLVAISFAVSGFTALGYEVVWTRLLQFFLGTMIYAFSAMLSIYLLGIALGSFWGRRYAAQSKDPLVTVAVLEIAVAFLSILNLSALNFLDVDIFQNVFGLPGIMVAAIIVFPVTVLLGALFPLVSQSYTKHAGMAGEALGKITAYNTAGAILGSLASGFVLIPLLGTVKSVIALAWMNLLVGVVLLLSNAQSLKRPWAVTLALAGGIGVIVASFTTEDPLFSVVRKRILRELRSDAVLFLHQENVSGTITAFGSRSRPLDKHLWINGSGMTNLVTETKLMAHLPLALCQNPREVLVVCFGMGTTVKSALTHENIMIDAVELIPETYRCFRFYHPEGPDLSQEPRVRCLVDDGRNFLLMHEKLYDVITVDPPPPIHSAGTVNLYSREFFRLCQDRLRPEGILCLWVYSSGYTELRMIMRTFQDVFPHTTLWRSPDPLGGFYLIGSRQPLEMSRTRFRQIFESPRVKADIHEWDHSVPSAGAMAELFILGEQDLAKFVQGAPVITDNHPYTEFPLWRFLFNPDSTKALVPPSVIGWKQKNHIPGSQ